MPPGSGTAEHLQPRRLPLQRHRRDQRRPAPADRALRPVRRLGQRAVAPRRAGVSPQQHTAALYGHDLVGPWVTSLTPEEAERSKALIGGALVVRGFANARPYPFGDPAAARSGYAPFGLPFCAGYAIGFRLVQAYLARTGRSIAEATCAPTEAISAAAGYFA